VGRGWPERGARRWRRRCGDGLTGVDRSRRARAKFGALNERKARLEHGGGLTRSSGRRIRGAGSAATLVGGVVRAEFAERAVRWSSGLLDPEVRLVGLLQSWGRGQRESNGAGGDNSRWRRDLHLRVVRRNSGETRAELVDRGLGEALGVEAKLGRWSAGARAQCCGWSTAERIAARRSKVGRSRSWLRVAAMGRCSRRRCSGAFKESWPRSRYACTRKGIAGDHADELGRGEERKEGDGPTG